MVSFIDNLLPSLLTQQIFFPGTPTIKEYGNTFFVTTAPAPIKEYSPISNPQIIVAFAPMVTPSSIIVFLNSFFFSISALGFITFLKTHE